MSRPLDNCKQCIYCPTGESQGTDGDHWFGKCSQECTVIGHYDGVRLILYPPGNPGKCPKFKHVTRHSKVLAGVV